MLLFIFPIYLQKEGLAKKMSESQTDTACLWQKNWQSDRRSLVITGR